MFRWLRGRAGSPGPMAVLAALLALTAPAAADGLFASPGLGMPPPALPRATPPPKSAPMPSYNANQCQLIAGTCPTGRLQRSGNLCFCVGAGGVRQGTSRTKPQDARPASP